MAHVSSLASKALCPDSSPAPQPITVAPSAQTLQPSSPPALLAPSTPIRKPTPAPESTSVASVVPSPQPSPQPITVAPSAQILQPFSQPALLVPSSPISQLSPRPSLVLPPTLCTLPAGLVPPVRDRLPSPTRRAARAAPWLETLYSPDNNIPLTSTPTWSHRTQSAGSDATSVLSSQRTNNADGSQATFTDYRLPFAGFTNTVLGAVAGRRFWRMPKGSTHHFVEFMTRECSMLQSPSPAARQGSVAHWLGAVPTPLRQSPSPPTSFLRRPSPLSSSFFGSSTGSPPAVVPESPLFLRSGLRNLPVAPSCFRSLTASSSSSSSDDWPFGPRFRPPRARSLTAALVDEWDDGFAERSIDSPSPPSRLRNIPISPLGSEYFRSSIGAPSPSPVRAIPITPLGSEYFRSSIGAPSPSPVRAIPITPLGSEYFRSSIGAPSPSPVRAIPITPLGSEYFRSSIGSPGAPPVASSPSPVACSPRSPSLDPAHSSASSSACSSSCARSQSPPAPTPSPSPSPSPPPVAAVTRSPTPAPALSSPVPRSPAPVQLVEPSAPSVAPSSAPEPQLSWKIAAGIVAGAFAITCLASHYLF